MTSKGLLVDDLLSEKEQIEKMRAWWSDYGWYVIGGVALGAIILFGINQYRSQAINAEVAASALYDEISRSVTDGNLEAAEAVAAQLDGEYGNSAYAAQSKLAMARLYMDKNRDQDAAVALNALLDMRGFEHLKHVARVRLAKVLLYQGKPEEVLSLIEDQGNAAFAARYAEVLGDAYVALGRYDEARASYQAALGEVQPTVDQGLVQLKLLDLPREGAAAAAADTPAEADGE
jgi:predicted negative regulator of RcsB-dependent stress response